MREIFELIISFARVGVLTFGGGYAMLPMLRREIVDKRGWATDEELLDWFAVSQCTPGVIAVNVATFAGCKRRGVIGGAAATLGVALPSFVIILILAAFIQRFADNAYVASAFAGIRVCVCVLILNTVVKLLKKAVKDWPSVLIFALVFAASAFLKLQPVPFVVLAAVAGIAIQSLKARRSV